MSKFEKLYKQICYTRTLRGLNNLLSATLTEIVKAFCEIMESAGYRVGIYSSESFFNSEMNDGELTRYSHWVARWGKNKPAPKSGAEMQMWQFGGETNLIRSNKINGRTCDQDY